MPSLGWLIPVIPLTGESTAAQVDLSMTRPDPAARRMYPSWWRRLVQGF